MALMTLTKDNFKREALEAQGLVLVDFWASWCGPCRMLSPIVDQLAEERTDVKVGKVNVDEEQDLAQEYRIMTIPTLLLFKDGQRVASSVGVKSKADIVAMIEQAQ